MNVTTAVGSTAQLNNDLPDYRFAFVEALNEGIGFICDEVAAGRSDAFCYRGSDLRYAVERGLYFWAANNDSLYAAFAEFLMSGDDVRARETVLGKLRSRLTPTSSFRAVRTTREWLRRVRAIVRYRLPRRGAGGHSVQTSDSIETLFVLHHPKFANYLRSVLSELGPAAALCATGPSIVLDASNQIQHTPLGAPRISWGKGGSGIRAFPYYMQLFDMVSDTLRRVRPLRVVVAEGNSPVDELVKRAADSLQIPTVCIQQGWSPIPHAGFRNMSFSRMLVWGDGFAELLRPYNPGQSFRSVGNPAIAASVADSGIFSRNTVAFFLQAPSPLIGDRTWEAFLELAKWTAGRFPDTKILVREHPNHRLSDEERLKLASMPNVAFVNPGTSTLSAVLQKASCVVTVYSSTIMESIAVGVLPIIANFTSMPHYWPDVSAIGAAIEVKTTDAARSAINKCLSDRDYHSGFESGIRSCARQFFTSLGDQATENIVKEIRSSGTPAL